MATETVVDIAGTLDELKAQVAALVQRMETLERGKSANVAAAAPAPAVAPAPAAVSAPVEAGITEEEVLAIAAAIGAFLGVRAHIRHIRLLSSNAWAQQGRVFIQASHRLG